MASSSSSLSLGATQSLLADMASQHERLEQLTVDLGRALSAARVATDFTRALLEGVPEVLASSEDLAGDEPLAATGYAQSLLDRAPSGGLAAEFLPPGGVQAGFALRPPLALPSVGVDSVPDFDAGLELDRDTSLEVEHPESLTRETESHWRATCRKLLPLSDCSPDGSATCNLVKGVEDRARSPPTTTSNMDVTKISPAQASASWTSADDLWHGMGQVSAGRRNAVFRLQARLGKRGFSGHVTALDVHRAVTSLGLVRYTFSDIERWLVEVNRVCVRRSSSQSSSGLEKLVGITKVWRSGLFSAEDSNDSKHLSIPCKAFMQWILREDAVGQVNPEFQKMTATVREVLFSGDANRLVAELANVRVDDVAAPMEKPDFLTYMEPLVGLAIFFNGIFIGLQTSRAESSQLDSWFWGNTAFCIFFILEISLRAFTVGLKEFLVGPERWWNLFDVAVVSLSVVDIILEAASFESEVAPMVVVRSLRLTRVVRLVRLFRLHYMKELSIMVRGLMAGLQTLFCAMILLFFTLYVLGILATTTIGQSSMPVPEIAKDELFATLPNAVFTSFRCFMNDCTTSDGKPIVKLLSDRYGVWFILGYVAGMMFVTFGLFNLIIAIYIENTLHAAKTEGDYNRHQRQRESVRIAQLTRQLLKKFCAMQSVWNDSLNGTGEPSDVKRLMSMATFNDLGEMSMPVSKEMFLCIIQDASVQKLMDELDIPPERASLFDVLDADGSGDLQLVELITGLLRVRGEANKSDIVGTLLAVRVVQEMIREQSLHVTELEGRLDAVEQAVGCGNKRVLQRRVQGTNIEHNVHRKSSITAALERLNLPNVSCGRSQPEKKMVQ